jgi:hypothetical protein
MDPKPWDKDRWSRIRLFTSDTNPDPNVHFDAEPDSAFHYDADPDQAFHFDADMDPLQLQRVSAYRGCRPWYIFVVRNGFEVGKILYEGY